MSRLTRIKRIFKKSGLILTFLPGILLILGCFFIFVSDTFLSFVFSLILPILLVLNLIFGVYWLVKKKKNFLFSLFGIILYFICFDSFVQFDSFISSDLKSSSSELNTLSILSYNTNGFKNKEKGKVGLDGEIVNFIKNRNTDIFCIQEFSAIKYKYFEDYPYWFKTNISSRNKSVMAIFSKHPITEKGYIDFPNTSNGAMFVDVIINKRNVRIYNLHLESYKVPINIVNFKTINGFKWLSNRIGKAEKLRKNQVSIIKTHMDSFNGSIIICGDFNSTQFSSTYNSLKVNKKDSFIEAGSGFGATYNLFKYPFRLDYILVDDSFEVLSHQNFDLKFSDHEPILTKFIVN